MKGRFLIPDAGSVGAPDIYADKSALVLQWLLLNGANHNSFTLRQVSNESLASLGLVQRVLDQLVRRGFVAVSGVRTAKTFSLKRPRELLLSWAERYRITEKVKMWTYRSRLGSREAVLEALMRSDLWSQACLALHSAARFTGFPNSNLETLEMYVLDLEARKRFEEKLELEPQERGYEVLLLNPYYKSVLKSALGARLLTSSHLKTPGSHLFCSPPLLTFLDLYNFPLRGREQAEFFAQRAPVLKRIFQRRGSPDGKELGQ